MKKLVALMAVLQMGLVNASVIAIMDSGTDITHKDLAPLAWTNKKEKEGSKIDLDGSGLPGDVHGWDYTTNSGNVFDNKYTYLMTEDVNKFFVLYAKYEMKTITESEFQWLKAATENKELMGTVDFIGSYAHGTHVAGIASINNPKAQLLSIKILPTELPESKKVNFAKDGVNEELAFMAGITFEEYKQQVIQEAKDLVTEMTQIHSYLNFQKVDVVNQSFGASVTLAAEGLTEGFLEKVKRQPTDQELAQLIVAYFRTLREKGPAMFAAARDTLFVIAAGNDSSNNDELPAYPADIQAPNKIVVAATVGYSSLADFSNFGALKVDVAAPGVAIKSTAPAQSYTYMSGTSQATPFVTDTIGLVKDINPELGQSEIKDIILRTVDVKSWLKGKVRTSGIVNKERAMKAALLSKTMNVDVAIEKARKEVADVAAPKSLNKLSFAGKLNYKPLLPSLSIKF